MRTAATYSLTKTVKNEIENQFDELRIRGEEFGVEKNELSQFVYCAMPNAQLFMRLGFNQRNNRPYVPESVKFELKKLQHGIDAVIAFIGKIDGGNTVDFGRIACSTMVLVSGERTMEESNKHDYLVSDIDIATHNWFSYYVEDYEVERDDLVDIMFTLLVIKDEIHKKAQMGLYERD